MQSLLYLRQKWKKVSKMRTVLDCMNAFKALLTTEYVIILGRKGVSVTLRLRFDKKDCFHLMGMQYLADRPELNRDRGKIFDEISNCIINVKTDHSLFLLFSDTDSVLSYIRVFSPRSVQTISPAAAAAVPATYM